MISIVSSRIDILEQNGFKGDISGREVYVSVGLHVPNPGFVYLKRPCFKTGIMVGDFGKKGDILLSESNISLERV